MKKFISNKIVLTVIGIIVFLIGWLVISYAIDERSMVFPNPFVTFAEAFKLLGKQSLYIDIGYSMFRTLIGFLLAFGAAILFGTLAGHFHFLEKIFKPTMIALRSVPTVALVFLFIVLSGAKWAPIFIVFLISFPILYESVCGGFKSVDNELLNATKVDGSNWIKTIWYIKLPLAMPYIFVGMVSSFALSFKIEIMAEVITGDTGYGLGSSIAYAQSVDPANMVPIFAYSIIAIIFIMLLTIFEVLVKKFVHLEDKK